MKLIRTFLAVPLSPETRGRAAKLRQRLLAGNVELKLVEEENLHFTLAFLGDIELTAVHALCQAAGAAVARHDPFDLVCGGVGAFPDLARPRVVWLGVQYGGEEMIALQADLVDALSAAGFAREERRFRPHLTLGRVRRGADLSRFAPLLEPYHDFAGGVTTVEEVVVYASHLERNGPRYEELAALPLNSQ